MNTLWKHFEYVASQPNHASWCFFLATCCTDSKHKATVSHFSLFVYCFLTHASALLATTNTIHFPLTSKFVHTSMVLLVSCVACKQFFVRLNRQLPLPTTEWSLFILIPCALSFVKCRIITLFPVRMLLHLFSVAVSPASTYRRLHICSTVFLHVLKYSLRKRHVQRAFNQQPWDAKCLKYRLIGLQLSK